MSNKKKVLLLMAVAGICTIIPPVIGFCDEVAHNGGMLSMPDAMALLGVLATIVVALIRYVPSKNLAKQPIHP